MPADPNRLLDSLADALGMVEFDPRELEQPLDQLVDIAASVFGVAGAGLRLLGGVSRLHLVGASDAAGRALGAAQARAGEGPGIEATRRGKVVAVDELACEGRWSEINRAVEPYGIVSVLSAPIVLSGEA